MLRASTHGKSPTTFTALIIDTGLPSAYSFNARLGDSIEFYNVQGTRLIQEGAVQSMKIVTNENVLGEADAAMKNVNAQVMSLESAFVHSCCR